MINENIFEIIEELEDSGYKHWQFKFNSADGGVDLLLSYLGYSVTTDMSIINELPKAAAYLDSIGADNFDITYGYKTLKFRLRYNESVVPENIIHIYRQLSHYFHAPEKLIYGFGYGLLNHYRIPAPSTLKDISLTGLYLEINYV